MTGAVKEFQLLRERFDFDNILCLEKVNVFVFVQINTKVL